MNDEIAIAISKDFDIDFSYESMLETKKIKDKITETDKKGRLDLRDETIFTIDSIQTKDMDDAVSVKKLYNGNITATGDITLIESIENYDFIHIEIAYLNGEGNPVCGYTMAAVDYIKATYHNQTSIWIDGGNNDRSAKVAFSNATTMKVGKASSSDAIIGVYGIKLESGGGASKEILYTNATNTNPATISLTNDFSNFDILSIRAFRDADSIPENSIFLTIDTQLLQINQVINILGWAGNNEYILYKLTASDELTLIMQGSGLYIREIAGVKN